MAWRKLYYYWLDHHVSGRLPSRADIDAAWAREAEDRIDAYERGDIAAIPASQVFERIEKKFSYRALSALPGATGPTASR